MTGLGTRMLAHPAIAAAAPSVHTRDRSRAMRVCIFTETFHPVVGGGETQARLLADGLSARGAAVSILTRRSDASLPASERVGDVRVRRLAPSGTGQLKKWGLLMSGLRALLQMHREYDVVLVSGFRIVGLTAVVAAKLLGKRVVLKADSQGEMSGEFFRPGLARFGVRPSSLPFRGFLSFRNLVLRRADAFAAITEDVVGELVDAKVDPAIIHRIPNAVDTSRFFPPSAEQRLEARERLGLPRAGRIVVYTGRLVSYKGLPLLLAVWSRIHGSHPDALLVLVGSGGLDIHACEEALRATVGEKGLEGHVIFTGNVRNVEEYLRAADIFVFPTENDAFPSSLLEAMTSGLPVVTTPVGAIKEIVRDGQTGLLVRPRDPNALASALERLLDDRVLSARLGRSAHEAVQGRYSAERVTEQYVALFEGLASR